MNDQLKTSKEGRKFIRDHEGCKLEAYQDGAGIWTIGVGHTSGVTKGMTCDDADSDAWLTSDLQEAEACIRHMVKVPLTQNQFDALVSFTFNLGGGALARSSLLRLLNEGLYANAAMEFEKWCLVAGKPSLGLARRRADEAHLFRSA